MVRNSPGTRAYVMFVVLLMAVGLPWSACIYGDMTGDQVIPPGSRALPSFTNVSDTVGLAGKGGSFISWADYNNDGYVDLIVNGNKLYENGGPPGFMFTDVTGPRGLTGSGKATWADYDNDGDLDMYVANWDDRLWQNQGPPNYDFVDVTVAAGNVKDTHPGTAASWGDMDMDGDLDLYVVNGEVWDPYQHYPDTLWENDGDGTFTNITEAAGVNMSNNPYYGRGALWSDFDNDGWQDLYVSNYRLQPNYMWYNNRNGTFTERAKELDVAGLGRTQQGNPGGNLYGHTIGSSYADFNNDGWFDIFVSNLAHKDPDRGRFCDDSKIYINNGYPYWNFTDIRATSGIPTKPVGGATHGYYDDENFANAAIADFDNDGWMDVYIPQVYNHSWMYSYLYHNEGDLTWMNVSSQLGFENVVDTYAGAWADYDNDGDMDLMTAGRQNEFGERDVDTPVRLRLYRNEGNGNNWLKVNLTGVESNRNGVGAKVTVSVGDRRLVQQVETGMGSHGQQNDMRPNFGLGADTMVEQVEIVWPSGIIQTVTGVSANQQLNITEDTSGPRITSISAVPAVTTPDSVITLSGQTTGTIGTYSWDFEGDLVPDWDGANNQQQTFTAHGTWEYHPTFMVMAPAGDLGFFMTAKVLVENVPPVADIGPDVTVHEDQEVWFNATNSTDNLWDRANLTYWYSFGDGTNTTYIEETLVNHTYNETMNYTVRLRVEDPFGETDEDEMLVEVLNVEPTVELISNDTIEEDVVMAFNATGNDTLSDLAAGLEFKWDFDDGHGTDWLDDPAVTHTFLGSGEFNVSVSVKDDDDAIVTDHKVVTVYDVQPEAELETKVFSIDEDGVVTLRGFGSDTPSDEEVGLEYMWDFGDGNTTDWGAQTEVAHTYTRSGNFTAKFIVRDDDNITANDTAQVMVLNVPPIAQISESPTDLVEDEEGLFEGLGIDTPTDHLSLRFKWIFGDGNETGWVDTADATHVYTMAGDFPVLFYVMDNDGDMTYVDTTVTVTNPGPTLEVLSPDRTTFDEDVTVTFEGNGTDTTSDVLTLGFTWTIDGAIHQGKKVEHVFTKKGVHKVEFKAEDDEGATTSKSLDITIRNVEPTVKVKVDKTTIKEGEMLKFEAEASDSPSDVDGLDYEWDFGPGNTGIGGEEANASCTFEDPGTFKVTVTVTDDEDAEASATVTITILKRSTGGPSDTGLSAAVIYGAIGAVVIVVLLVVLFLFKDRLSGRGKKKDTIDEEEEDATVEDDEDEGKKEEE